MKVIHHQEHLGFEWQLLMNRIAISSSEEELELLGNNSASLGVSESTSSLASFPGPFEILEKRAWYISTVSACAKGYGYMFMNEISMSQLPV